MNIFIILFLAAAELVVLPLYIKEAWPKKRWSSLALKMTLSSIFILFALNFIRMQGSFSIYSKYILTALIFGFIGDFMLHIPSKTKKFFGIGMFSFLVGHLVYTKAYYSAMINIDSSYSFFNTKDIIIFGIIAVLFFVTLFGILKLKFNIILIPFALYAAAIGIMSIKAISLGVMQISYDKSFAVPAFIVLTLGSMFFTISDIILGAYTAKPKLLIKPLRALNSYTYFIGQMLLASSINFVEF